MNKVVILGRLTRDPEVRYTPSQKVVCSFTLAVNRPFKNENGERAADFVPVSVWGKAAELCGNSLAKGHRLLVEGRLQTRNYEGKDGQRRFVMEVVAENVEFIERRTEAQGQPPAEAQPVASAQQPPEPPKPAAAPLPQAGYKPANTVSYNRQGSYKSAQQGSYPSKQASYAPRQGSYQPAQKGSYKPAQQGSYQRPGTAPSPFDEEVPF